MQKAVPLAGKRQKSCISRGSYHWGEIQWSLLKTWVKLTLRSLTKCRSFPSYYTTGWKRLISKCRESRIPSKPHMPHHCWREHCWTQWSCTAHGTLKSHLCGTAHKKAKTFLCCLAKLVLTSEQLLIFQALNWLLKSSLGQPRAPSACPAPWSRWWMWCPLSRVFQSGCVPAAFLRADAGFGRCSCILGAEQNIFCIAYEKPSGNLRVLINFTSTIPCL